MLTAPLPDAPRAAPHAGRASNQVLFDAALARRSVRTMTGASLTPAQRVDLRRSASR